MFFMEYISHYYSPLGGITLASDGKSLTGLWFDGQKHFGSTLESISETNDDLPIFRDTRLWLDIYFKGKDPLFTPKLNAKGTEFRKHVWTILLGIPYGETMTYGEIACKIAEERNKPSFSAQAVGGAVGHNPISLIIPCHRVVGYEGNLTGYAGGIERKRYLLRNEERGKRNEAKRLSVGRAKR